MVKVKEDLTGKVFGKLTVMCQDEDHIMSSGEHRSKWKCVCECGNTTSVLTSHLKSGKTTSCGCFGKTWFRKYNTYSIENGIVTIYCDTGESTTIDESCFDDFIRNHYWRPDGAKRKETYFKTTYGHNNTITLHRYIMRNELSNGKAVDHIDRCTTNNRLNNLRVVTPAENNKNRKVDCRSNTGHIGVRYMESIDRYVATLVYNGKTVLEKRFKTLEDAVEARKKAEEKYRVCEMVGA